MVGESRAALRDEIASLRRELATARTKIKHLEQRRNVDAGGTIAVWHINRKAFTATPFDANGKAGTPINLRPLFEEYHEQTR